MIQLICYLAVAFEYGYFRVRPIENHFDTRLWPEGIMLQIEKEWYETEVLPDTAE